MIYLSNEMFWKRTGGPNGSLEIDVLEILELQLQEMDFRISKKNRGNSARFMFFF